MKKKDLVTALAIIALSATSVMALELNTDAANEMTPEIKATIEQAVSENTQSAQEIPDYKSLNQMFIDKLEKAGAESKYQTIRECSDCIEIIPSEGVSRTNTHSSVKEIYDKVLTDYKNLLEVLNTKRTYNKKNKQNIHNLISKLNESVKAISSEERDEYIIFLCKQDRYYLKAADSVVNMAFLLKDNENYYTLECTQEPVKIKANTLLKKVSEVTYSSEMQGVLDGYKNNAIAGK